MTKFKYINNESREITGNLWLDSVWIFDFFLIFKLYKNVTDNDNSYMYINPSSLKPIPLSMTRVLKGSDTKNMVNVSHYSSLWLSGRQQSKVCFGLELGNISKMRYRCANSYMYTESGINTYHIFTIHRISICFSCTRTHWWPTPWKWEIVQELSAVNLILFSVGVVLNILHA